ENSGATITPAGRGPDLVVDDNGDTLVAYARTDDGLAHLAGEQGDGSYGDSVVDNVEASSGSVSMARDPGGDVLVGFGGTTNPQAPGNLHAFIARRHAGTFSTATVDDSAALSSIPLVKASAAGVFALYIQGDNDDIARLATASAGGSVFTALTVATAPSGGAFSGLGIALDDDGNPVIALSSTDDDIVILRVAP
ncbi:MAG TPA: hypothetical protein VGO62_13900, partial [Myxococcota bacterium]